MVLMKPIRFKWKQALAATGFLLSASGCSMLEVAAAFSPFASGPNIKDQEAVYDPRLDTNEYHYVINQVRRDGNLDGEISYCVYQGERLAKRFGEVKILCKDSGVMPIVCAPDRGCRQDGARLYNGEFWIKQGAQFWNRISKLPRAGY